MRMNYLNILPTLPPHLFFFFYFPPSQFNHLCSKLQVPSVSSKTLLKDLPFPIIFNLSFYTGYFYSLNKHCQLYLKLY